MSECIVHLSRTASFRECPRCRLPHARLPVLIAQRPILENWTLYAMCPEGGGPILIDGPAADVEVRTFALAAPEVEVKE